MKVKHKVYISNNQQSPIVKDRKRRQITTPIKSPSPDKHSSSIIPKTPSPEIHKQSVNSSGKKEPIAATICKKIGQREKNYVNFNQNTEGKEQMAWIANMSTEINGRRATLKNVDQTLRSERNCERNRQWDISIYDKSCSPSELDYLRIIREKEQTIKQLRQILEQLDKNSSINPPADQQKLKKAEKRIKELQKQVKVLQVQNECLINVIQNNQVNLPSNKEAILQREIAELRQSLKMKQEEVEQTRHCSQNASQKLLKLEISNKQLTQYNQELQVQCEKLVRIMKEKVDLQKSKSQLSSCSQIRRGQKLTLNLIKQQYNENLALMKLNFQADLEKLGQTYNKKIEKANHQIDQLNLRCKMFEESREKLYKKIESGGVRKQKKKEQNLQIQFLLQKYQKTEKDLEMQRSINQKLSTQLQMAQQTLRSIEIRSLEVSQIFESSDRIHKQNDSKKNDQKMKDLEAQIIKMKDQNKELKTKLSQIQTEKENQIKNYETKLQTVVTCYENQLKDRRNSIDDKINELQQNYMSQLTSLRRAIQEAHHQNYQLKKEKEYWSEEYKKFTELFQEEIKDKNILIQSLQRELQRVDQEAKSKKQQKEAKLGELDTTIIIQLSKLKEEVQLLNLKILQQNQVISQYESVSVQLEIKIQENQRLLGQLQELRDEISRYQKEHTALLQKINSLQKNLTYREYEAKERKTICEQFFTDKTKMQKEALLNSKIKLANLENKKTSTSLQEISILVDKLISTDRDNRRKMQKFQQI